MSSLKYVITGRIIWALASTALAFLVLLQGPSAFAQDRCWTTAGSAGTVDILDHAIVSLISNKVVIKTSVTSGTADIRYNVVAVDGVFGGSDKKKVLKVLYIDNGPNARVVVRVKQMNLSTAAITQLVEFRSDDPGIPQLPSAQKQEKAFNLGSPELDFSQNVYFIEAFVQKFAFPGTSGNPTIHGIQICPGIE